MSTSTSLSSLGYVCQTLQRPPGVVRKAMEALGIKPSVVINAVAHYSDEDVDRVRRHLAQQGSK